jgi:hypothetical protein
MSENYPSYIGLVSDVMKSDLSGVQPRRISTETGLCFCMVVQEPGRAVFANQSPKSYQYAYPLHTLTQK